MSIDILQKKIRKFKNPSMVMFSLVADNVPRQFLVDSDVVSGYETYAKQLIVALKDIVPALRFDFNSFSAYGEQGIAVLRHLTEFAANNDCYVVMDAPFSVSATQAEIFADLLLGDNSKWKFDGLIICPYIGSDAIIPYHNRMKHKSYSLFCLLRTANRSATELQDLLTGSRLVHMAMADVVNRYAQDCICRCGYSNIGAVTAATSGDSVKNLRDKFKYLFQLVEGFDSPNANAKKCSFSFDKFGHGGIVCAGDSITAAWKDATDVEFADAAVSAALRMKKNLTNYTDIL